MSSFKRFESLKFSRDNMKKVIVLLFLLSFSFINVVLASDFKLNKEIAYDVNNIIEVLKAIA